MALLRSMLNSSVPCAVPILCSPVLVASATAKLLAYGLAFRGGRTIAGRRNRDCDKLRRKE